MISKHISYDEATNSYIAKKLGIDNEPNSSHWRRMINVAIHVFEPLREHFNVPIHVSSFFRSEELNTVIGGSKTSQHVKGEAIDINANTYGEITNRQVFDYIKDNLEFDQLIWEHGNNEDPDWVHVSLKYTGENRKQILKAYRDKNKNIKYKTYVENEI